MKRFISKKTVLKIICILYILISILVGIPQIDKLITKDYAEISQYVALDDAWDITIKQYGYFSYDILF